MTAATGTGWHGTLEVRSSLTLWGQAKEALVPMAIYWVWVLYAYGIFVLAVAMTESIAGVDVAFLTAFGLATVSGVLLGQLCAFVGVRSWVLVTLGALMWALFFLVLAGGGYAFMNNQIVAAIVIAVVFLGPVAMTGGLWCLETNRALWSTWLPMVWTVGACLIWIEKKVGIGAWEQGAKHEVWDLISLVMFVPSVGLFLLYLVTRETHRLATWKRGPTAPLTPKIEERGVSRPRLTIGGLVALMALAVAVAGATALVAPYLWRTGAPDGQGPETTASGEWEPSQQELNRADRQGKQGDPNERNGKPREGGSGPKVPAGVQQMFEKMGEAAKQAAGTLCSLITVAILALIGALLAYRPLKRLFVIRHLRDPLWDVAPSTRIDQCWRLVEIALGDAGVHVRPGEDAAGLARRAGPVLKALSPVEVHGLDDVAEVADRVRFGLGVGPDDVAVIERFSRWVLDTVWERLDDKAQMIAMYRGV
ncbi:MAG: hypothetical protein EXR71_06560 [Myxococcales bacterium]|nr:hypothetical protein [Myxococcales bacterium]